MGSGKSSLLSALLGEMDKLNGKVNTKVSILLFELEISKYKSEICKTFSYKNCRESNFMYADLPDFLSFFVILFYNFVSQK